MPAGEAVRIRMYNVGFGDCFLLWLPADDGRYRTVLVDCGSHIGTADHGLREVADDVVRTVRGDGDVARIDVVIASHRHFDHIAGFDWKGWDSVEVGEVWLPWTEEHGAPDADRIRERQHRMAESLIRRMAVGSSGHLLVRNALSNRGAENTLLSGFAGAPLRRFLPHRDATGSLIPTDVLGDVRVHVLGPSRDERIIGLLDPPKEEAFEKDRRPGHAVDDGHREAPAKSSGLFDDRYLRSNTPAYAQELGVDAQLLGKLRAKAKFDLFAAAAALDDAINGTSLVLAFEVAGHTLLFSGDAEWGTWSVLLADEASRALLRRTTVYKVSHHGSFNGSPRSFVEQLLSDDAISLMSFSEVEKWPYIPPTALTDGLSSGRRRLLRTDRLDSTPAHPSVTRHPDGLWLELVLTPRAEQTVPGLADRERDEQPQP